MGPIKYQNGVYLVCISCQNCISIFLWAKYTNQLKGKLFTYHIKLTTISLPLSSIYKISFLKSYYCEYFINSHNIYCNLPFYYVNWKNKYLPFLSILVPTQAHLCSLLSKFREKNPSKLSSKQGHAEIIYITWILRIFFFNNELNKADENKDAYINTPNMPY